MQRTTVIGLAFVLLTTYLCQVATEWHADFGPWVQATQGEIWPLPITRRVKDDFYILRPSSFQIRILGETCDIITDAVERYTGIILTEARIGRLASEGQSKTPVRDDPHFKGTLTGLDIHVAQSCEQNGEHWPHLYMKETYALEINETSPVGILSADTVWGVLRGLETFSQILVPSKNGPNLKVKCQSIVDGPRLPHRGLLLDTSRHYLPLSDILLTLDAMSYNKLNVLHWHIVDDNSFPYQSTRYPDLAAKGAYHASMIYTPNDVQKVVDYARLRGIRVMPEFDTPGHTRSWGMAYPDLLTTCYDPITGQPNGKLGPMNPINPTLYTFLHNLFSEIVQVFPDQYIHLGGDEVPFDCWASNPDVKAFMRSHNMSENFELLESEFISKVLDITDSLEANAIVWQEVFDNGVRLPATTVVHVWKGRWQKELESATKAGHPVLLSSCWYLDHLASGGDWKKYYTCNPLGFPGPPNVTSLMLGGEACMWGEFVDRNNVHPRIWPRASAAAERLWSFDIQDLDTVSQRLEEHACRMNRRGVPAQPPNGPGFCVM